MHYTTEQRHLPRYSPAEEKFNMISHLLASLLGVGMVVMALLFANTAEGRASGLVFGASLIFLYLASSIYHGLPVRHEKAKLFFQVVDHCSIFLLCAGSCTPFLFAAFQGGTVWHGWLFNVWIWLIALIGIALLIKDLNRYKKVSIVLYILIGVSLMTQSGAIHANLGNAGFGLMLTGGVVYCIGLVFYSIKKPWMHAVFHVMCVVASALHCMCVIQFII